MKFKIGDRVRVKDCFDGLNLKGKIGTVIGKGKRYDCAVEFDEHIEFLGHDCDGMGKRGHCRYGYERELEPVGINKIVITSDGKTTLARLYEGKKVVKSAEANCSPDDEFDFTKGAKIAFERLCNSSETLIEGERYKIIGKKEIFHFFDLGEIVKCVKVGSEKDKAMFDSVKTGKRQWVSIGDVGPCEQPKYYSGKVVCVESCCSWWTAGKIYEVVNGDIFDDKHIKKDEILDVPNLNDRILGNAKFIELKE